MAAPPTRASRIFWRVHLALTASIGFGVVLMTLAYRYFSGEWSRMGLFLGVVTLGAGGLAWVLRPR